MRRKETHHLPFKEGRRRKEEVINIAIHKTANRINTSPFNISQAFFFLPVLSPKFERRKVIKWAQCMP